MARNDDAYGRMMWDFHRGMPAEEIPKTGSVYVAVIEKI